MKCHVALFLILLFVPAIVGAQSTVKRVSWAQENQVRGYWTDPSTDLMWAAKDNGKDVSWKKAFEYCHDLRLAGYSDWRLATLEELEGIFDKDANAPGLAGPPKGTSSRLACKGQLVLNGQSMGWQSHTR